MHSQAIDEQVERGESLCDTMDRGVTDTHAEVSLHTTLLVPPALFTQQTIYNNNVLLPTDVLTRSAPATVRGALCSY